MKHTRSGVIVSIAISACIMAGGSAVIANASDGPQGNCGNQVDSGTNENGQGNSCGGGGSKTVTVTKTVTNTVTKTVETPGPETTVTKTVETPGPETTVTKTVETPGPTVTVTEPGEKVTVTSPAETVTVTQPGETVTVTSSPSPAPEVTVTQTAPCPPVSTNPPVPSEERVIPGVGFPVEDEKAPAVAPAERLKTTVLAHTGMNQGQAILAGLGIMALILGVLVLAAKPPRRKD